MCVSLCACIATLVLSFRLFALTQVVNQFTNCILYNWFATNQHNAIVIRKNVSLATNVRTFLWHR